MVRERGGGADFREIDQIRHDWLVLLPPEESTMLAESTREVVAPLAMQAMNRLVPQGRLWLLAVASRSSHCNQPRQRLNGMWCLR
jgi:hypothetical protein